MVRGFHPADRAADHDRAEFHRRRVGRRVAHPSAHVGIERQVDGAQQHLARAGLRKRNLLDAEVIGSGVPWGREARTMRRLTCVDWDISRLSV